MYQKFSGRQSGSLWVTRFALTTCPDRRVGWSALRGKEYDVRSV